MQNFKNLTQNGKIGICAPSLGCDEHFYYLNRCKNAVKNFNKLGHEVVFTEHCFGNKMGRSADARIRAEEFEKLFFDDSVEAIISMAGGEFELEILPYLNYKKLKKAKNKIFQGFSDNCCLSFILTTMCDKTSIYGHNLFTFGMKKWHKSIQDNYNFLIGKEVEQISFNKYEIESNRKVEGNELNGFNLTEKTCPTILSGESQIELSGRIIGGNLDVLSCICGTKFDNVKSFIKKYKKDGIIWFFESCDLSVLDQSRAIWKLKNTGWFEGAKGFLIGRPLKKETMFDVDYLQANYENLKDLDVPVVIDLDISHTSPNWFMVNGGKATFNCNKKQAKIKFVK